MRHSPPLFVALDLPEVDEAREIAKRLGTLPCGFKIGHQLLYTGGEALVRELIAEGRPVFVDAKLLDIGETVAKGAASIAAMGAAFLTVHARPKALAAAVRGRGEASLKILAVTVLTDLDDGDLAAEGQHGTVAETVVARARMAKEAGADGIVCSPREIAMVRSAVGPGMLIVTPGVRPTGAAQDDQRRIATPSEAIRAGASAIVVGRPILAAADPVAAAKAILGEMDSASQKASSA